MAEPSFRCDPPLGQTTMNAQSVYWNVVKNAKPA